MRLFSGALFFALLCGGCKSAPTAPPVAMGQLLLSLIPAQASVLVDDRPIMRQAAASEVQKVDLPVGPHRVEVYAPGYFHAYSDVAVAQGAPSRLEVVLRADPDG